MTERVVPMRAFRGMTWTLMTIFALYCMLILVPFFYSRLYMLTPEALISGLYDPKGYPPFALGDIGSAIYLIGVLVALMGPATIAAMGGVLALTLRRHWHQLEQKQRLLGSTAVIVAVVMLGVAVSPFGRTIVVWFLD